VRLTTTSKILLVVLALGVGYFLWTRVKPTGDGSLLGRPLRVGVVTWPGYAGGIVANNGFKANKDCIYWKDHKQTVEFMLMEDVDVRAKAFARGGPQGVDIVWSTVDFWANELPGFLKDGLKAKAVMQVDWSQGGDAIVADASIHRIEDLAGKKISLALFTPSHWLLEYSLEHSSLSEVQQAEIVKNLVGKNASPDARVDFVANKVDAAVVWEPDVTEALQKRSGAHILISSKNAAHLIADLMVAREDFIKEHPDVIQAFVSGWLDGTVEANRNPDLVVKLLMENEPVYAGLGPDVTRQSLATVKWADLIENTQMFGLGGSAPPLFDDLFKEAGNAWVRRGYIRQTVDSPLLAKDDSFLRAIYKESPPPAPTPEQPVQPIPRSECEKPKMTTPVTIHFEIGRSDLSSEATQVLNGVSTPQTFTNSTYFCVAGNTDNVGNRDVNIALSQRRAQSVVDYLEKHYHRDPSRFTAFGNGPDKPVDSNATPEGRAKNRRTDIEIVTK
jgi:NitT/TauT family transport system substrate-binding protein